MKSSRSISTVAACALIALGAGACGDDDDSDSEARTFTKGDLPGLVTPRSEKPEGTKVLAELTGPGTFAKDADSAEDRRRNQRLRDIGMRGDYQIEFEPTKRGVPFVAELAVLFKDAGAARAGLAEILKGDRAELDPAKRISAAGLGEESYGLNGKFERKYPTASFGLRTGNVVQIVRTAGEDEAQSLKQGRERARRLEARAQR